MRANGWVLSVMLSLGAGCGGRQLDNLFCDGAGCGFSDREWSRLRELSPLPPVRSDRSNRVRDSEAAARLGREFFFDARFSGPATGLNALGQPALLARAPAGEPTGLSCASCHDLDHGGADVTSVPGNVSQGAGWTDVNALSVVNSAYNQLWFRNGRADSSWALGVAVAESSTTMNGNRLHTAWVIADNYRTVYDVVFGPGAPYALPLPGRSADVAALTDPSTGQCLQPAGVCPAGCRLATSGVCWPRFPLAGKPGQPAWDDMDQADKDAVTRVLVNWAKAIDAYEATLVSGETPFDRFVREGASSEAISPAAKRGARLFVGKAACVDCHSGPLLSDGDFHNVGVPQRGPQVPTVRDCPAGATCDCVNGKGCLPWGARDGLDKLASPNNKYLRTSSWSDNGSDDSRAAELARPRETLEGAWRTPSLRNVAQTAPYMHDGIHATLAEVIAHYNRGGDPTAVGVAAPSIKPLGLTDGEQADLVAFLETLSAPLANLPLPSIFADVLVSTSPETPGTRCPRGGTLVQEGLDLNHDGVLEHNEIASSSYDCVSSGPDGGTGGAGGASGAGGGSGSVACPGTPQYAHTTTFGAIFDGWSVSSQYSSSGVAPLPDADGGMTGTITSIDPNDGSPTNGSLRLDIPFSAPAQTVLVQQLYFTAENFTDTIVTAQIRLLANGVISGPTDSVRAFLILKSTIAYVYAAGTFVMLDPSAGWMTLTIDPDAVAASAFPGYTACDIRELDIQIDTGATGSYIPGTILIDTIAVTPKHASDGGAAGQ